MQQTSPKLHIFLGRHESPRSGMWVNAAAVSQALLPLLEGGSLFRSSNFTFAGPTELYAEVPAIRRKLKRLEGFLGSRRGGFIRDLLYVVPSQEIFHGMSNFVPLLGGGKVVLTLHDLLQAYPRTAPTNFYEWVRRVWYRAMLAIMVSRSDKIITDHPRIADTLRAKFRIRSRPIVIYPPLHSAFLEAALPDVVARDRTVLAFTGQDRRKNLEGAVRTFAASAFAADHTLTIFAGSSRNKEQIVSRIESECRRIRAEIAWEIMSDVPMANMPGLFASAAAVLFPSFAEGFGYPIYEALSQGCQVVCDGELLIPEVRPFEDRVIFRCAPADDHSVVRALAALKAAAPSVEARSEAASSVRALLNPERAAQELMTIYRDLAEVS